MSYPKQRNNTIDIARGVAILGVLYGHALAIQHGTDCGLMAWFWSFHMPLFALVAGYFHRPKPFVETLVTSVKTLLAPCLVVSLLILFEDQIRGGQNDCISIIKEIVFRVYGVLTLQFAPCGFWFVIAIFNCKILLGALSRCSSVYVYPALFAICLAVVFLVPPIEMCQFTRSCALMLFMLIGIYAKRWRILEKPQTAFVAVLLLIVMILGRWCSIDILSNRFPMGVFNVVMSSVVSYGVIYYSGLWDRCRRPIMAEVAQVLAFCGRHSLAVLFVQALFIYDNLAITLVKAHTGLTNVYLLTGMFIVLCVLCSFMWVAFRSVLRRHLRIA